MPDAVDGFVLARIQITRVLTADGEDLVSVEAVDEQGEPLALVDALGMLRLAEDSVIRERMGEAGDD